MIIECEKCQTRFRLADERIPEGGGRVRCSRCQHRFHVKPRPPRESPHSIAERALENTSDTREDEDPDLENPTFLFDAPEQSSGGGAQASNLPPELAPTEADAPWVGGGALAEEPHEAPLLGFDESPEEPDETAQAEVEPIPLCAQGEPPLTVAEPEPLGLGDAGDFAEATLLGSEEDLGGEEIAEIGVPGEGLLAPEADPIQPEAASGEGALLEAEPAEEADSERWDDLDLLGDEGARADSSSPAWETSVPSSCSAPTLSSTPDSLPEVVSEPIVASTEEARLQSDRAIQPSRLAAVLLGLALLVAGTRAMYSFAIAPFPGPEQVRGAGWIASEIEAFRARDAAGRRLLVVRGRLAPLASDPPPRVRLALLDAAGQPVGEARFALLEWLDGTALSPAALSRRLGEQTAESGADASVVPAEIRGFTLLVDETGSAARRFRLELLAPGARGPT
jgi:predicted Zn finger-like uncharacterized protein